MNALTPILSPQEQRKAADRENLRRAAKLAENLAADPDSDWRKLFFLEAMSFCIDSDLSAEMDDLRHDLRIDAEGYPLNDEGERKGNTLRYVPLQRLEASGRRVA
jgi:hypothetical protein